MRGVGAFGLPRVAETLFSPPKWRGTKSAPSKWSQIRSGWRLIGSLRTYLKSRAVSFDGTGWNLWSIAFESRVNRSVLTHARVTDSFEMLNSAGSPPTENQSPSSRRAPATTQVSAGCFSISAAIGSGEALLGKHGIRAGLPRGTKRRVRSRLQLTLAESIRPLGFSDLLTASLSRSGTRGRGLQDAKFYGN